jgi:hypothetical protein
MAASTLPLVWITIMALIVCCGSHLQQHLAGYALGFGTQLQLAAVISEATAVRTGC